MRCWTGIWNAGLEYGHYTHWVWLHGQLHKQHALLYLFSAGLTQFLLLCCFSSTACSVRFDSMFPFLLHCLQGPSQAISTTRQCHIDNPQSFNLTTRWFHIYYPLDLCWETWLWDCQIFTMRISLFNKLLQYDVWHTNYIQADTACGQHVNVELASPN